MIKQSDVTIIIPHFGASEKMEYAFDQTITSLKETVDCPIVVAKNGGYKCQHITDIRIQEQGQCKAVNAAAAITNTSWLLVTNDDMVYPFGWFEKLTNDIQEYMFCISPKLIEPITGAPTFEQYFCGGAGGDFDKQKFLEFAKDYRPTKAPFFRKGFNLPFLISRDLWDTIGGYDINYDPWGSNGDSDLQAKIHLAGIQPYQNTNAIIYHFSQTAGTSHPDNRSFWEKNWHYFIFKWGFERASSPDVWTSTNIIDHDKLKYTPDWMGKYGDIK